MLKVKLLTFVLFYSFSMIAQTQRAEALRNNVVAISAKEENGFGFITGEHSRKLFIVTAAHVLDYVINSDQIVEIQFFQDYKKYSGRVIRHYPYVDVGLIEVDRPANFSWDQNCLGVATANADVAFVGRESEWYVPSGRALGTIFSLENNRIQADITSVTVGTSGAPLIAESGIIGMITETDGIKAIALDLNQLRAVLSEYDYFFALQGAGLEVINNTDDIDMEAIRKDIQSYKVAEEQDDVSGYQTYLRDFPNGEFRDKVISRIQELERKKREDQETLRWEIAETRKDIIGYEEYLKIYPNGLYSAQAKGKIKVIKENNGANENIVIDRDGNSYPTQILKDKKRWMIKNLNLKVEDSWCYMNKAKNCEEYGRLYTWKAGQTACSQVGDGWRLPSDEEWRNLAMVYGGLKIKTKDHAREILREWEEKGNPRIAYNNLIEHGGSPFSVRLGGVHEVRDGFFQLGFSGHFWSGSSLSEYEAFHYSFLSQEGIVFRGNDEKGDAVSIRCIKGDTNEGKK